MFHFATTDLAFLGVVFLAAVGTFLYTVILPMLQPLRYTPATHVLTKEIPVPEDAEAPVIDVWGLTQQMMGQRQRGCRVVEAMMIDSLIRRWGQFCVRECQLTFLLILRQYASLRMQWYSVSGYRGFCHNATITLAYHPKLWNFWRVLVMSTVREKVNNTILNPKT